MKETIYKEDAIKAFNTEPFVVDDAEAAVNTYLYACNVLHRIKNLPPVQPEQRKGEWIEHEDGLILCECSECHEKYMLYEEHVLGRNFCPNCGADMRGGNNAVN